MIQATDRERNLFLKGFKLSNSGKNEDPTYLGFKIMFDFGSLPVNPEYGWAPSPLLKQDNYDDSNSKMAESVKSPFGQPQYTASNPTVMFYSAYNYLLQREGSFANNNRSKRANAILQFTKLLKEINANSPWFFQSIDGLDKLAQVSKSGFQTSNQFDSFDTQRTTDKVLIIKTLESINLRVSALADLYNQATFDYDNMRWLVPRNLRKFTMWIFVTEIRNFFKTSRLINSSTTLTVLDNLSNLVQTNNNAGSSIGSGLSSMAESESAGGVDAGEPGNSFKSFANNVLDQSGISNDIAAFQNQTDQLGIKPVMIYECQQCEFDFSESTPIKSTIDMGSSSAEPEGNQFKIYVGKVRTKSQYPNIRNDRKPLVLADGYDQSRSSLEDLGNNALSLEELLGNAGQILTNVVSNAVSDLVNEGINSLINPALSGVDQSLLGNIYSFNPTQLARFTNESGKLGFNNLENFLNGAAETGIDNIFKGNLPTPQKTGQGGPPERVYPPIDGNSDSYLGVPGPDLGVPERVYPPVKADLYPNVPGSDLGVPDRIYPTVDDDVYSNVPGSDLGVPDRVYTEPGGDAYDGVPGFDLGVPDRVYPEPEGDAYENVPGSDLGVPDRVYPDFSDDVYLNVPGSDLGVPDRVYPDFSDDVYLNVPGSDLGVPSRNYTGPEDDVYKDVPGKDLGPPFREYGGLKEDVYQNVPGSDLGVPDREYGSLQSDVYPGVPGTDLGVPIRQYPSLDSDVYSDVPGSDLGVPDRNYPLFNSTVYDKSNDQNTITQNSSLNEFFPRLENFSPKLEESRVYDSPVLSQSRGELRSRENNFDQVPGNVYGNPDRKGQVQNLGNVFPLTSGDFMVEKALNLGNSKPADKYNISLGEFNPDDYEV